MDDFGSGYSSLNMLNELPIDILKLDMGFVQGDLSTNSNNILSFIISLAKWMDYAVVAEGIETEEQIQMLRNILFRDIILQSRFHRKNLKSILLSTAF